MSSMDQFARPHYAPSQDLRNLEPALQGAGVWLVIPCYKVTDHIMRVIDRAPPWVEGIVCVDDACPDRSGDLIEASCADPRVRVLRLAQNQGVGGATLAGYQEAARLGGRILVKVDGDDQMDLSYLPQLVTPILLGEADYAKGNRFSSVSHLQAMPGLRIFGNAGLSFLAKLSTGYWNVFDPTNGFTAIEASVAGLVAQKPVARRFFFETDLLYHLGTLRAVVRDVPIPARYGDEVSNLKISQVIGPFAGRHLRNFVRRVLGQYFVRDFNVATLELIFGTLFLGFGAIYALNWMAVRDPGQAASAGVVMTAALPVIIGVQLLLQAMNFDVVNVPVRPIHPYLRTLARIEAAAHGEGEAVTGQPSEAAQA
ncbi:glycosyltransferase family 2 protein [Phenylobacterium sp.]|uniref:glycosyltransferase family 2 protein n=1 Tax=Phenylobacterium sp. TaxID=1871053 RepID=UPI0025F77243|nr:glycosyltransferase family 2 protein [Phenylobacterium sp.]|tara:strand:+ start:11866 stop:12972 length:1107 start_codon:yes stop_codon:yes gene_type:complete